MKFFRENIVIKCIMVAFAAVQMAAVMPHHHHDSTDTLCINPLHCLEAHSHENEGGSGHHHADECAVEECTAHLCLHNTAGHGHSHDGSDAECSFVHLDLNPPVRDRIAFSPPVVELADYFMIMVSEPVSGVCHEHGNVGDVLCSSVFGGTIALYTHVCTSAIPPRAPSFLV